MIEHAKVVDGRVHLRTVDKPMLRLAQGLCENAGIDMSDYKFTKSVDRHPDGGFITVLTKAKEEPA